MKKSLKDLFQMKKGTKDLLCGIAICAATSGPGVGLVAYGGSRMINPEGDAYDYPRKDPDVELSKGFTDAALGGVWLVVTVGLPLIFRSAMKDARRQRAASRN